MTIKKLAVVPVLVALIASSTQASAERRPCLNIDITPKQIDTTFKQVINAVKEYNKRAAPSEEMKLPVKEQCFFSAAFIPTLSFYPNVEYSSCAVAENCTGRYAGYMANSMFGNDWIQVNASVGRGDNMVRVCFMNDESFEGSCLSR